MIIQDINTMILGNGRAAYGKKILPELAAKLSWSHIIELLPLKTNEERMYNANEAVTRNYGTKELRRQISRKALERREAALLIKAPFSLLLTFFTFFYFH
ncbi:MAG: DUF1016 N-terminal domain-containing protein [Erysipelotrichales bacterium]|nr:DUF1016 N-terminal domain-containing protein [Erysipelotrichales bacterium]